MPEANPGAMVLLVVNRGLDAMAGEIEKTRERNRPASIAAAASTFRTLRSSWETAADDMQARLRAADEIAGDLTLRAEVRNQRVAEARTQMADAASVAAAELQSSYDILVRGLSTAVQLPRPGPVDATQEAALANLRADLAMVLDPVSTFDVPGKLADLVSGYAAAGDDLAVWFITSSGWADRYADSRGVDEAMRDQLPVTLTAAVGPVAPEAQAVACLLDVATDRMGLSGSIVAMRTLLQNWARGDMLVPVVG